MVEIKRRSTGKVLQVAGLLCSIMPLLGKLPRPFPCHPATHVTASAQRPASRKPSRNIPPHYRIEALEDLEPVALNNLGQVLVIRPHKKTIFVPSAPAADEYDEVSVPSNETGIWFHHRLTLLGRFGLFTGIDGVSLNDAGQVAGNASLLRPRMTWIAEPFLWQNGRFESLGGRYEMDRSPQPGKLLNNLGQVVLRDNAIEGVFSGPYNGHIYFRSKGKVQDLGPIDKTSSRQGDIVGLNNQGQMIGNITGNSNNEAFVWTKNGTARGLGTLGGGRSYVTAINDKGQIVGGSSLAAEPDIMLHGFLWQNGKMRDLGTLPGCLGSVPRAINNNGDVVGYLYIERTQATTQAFLYRNGKMQNLNALLPPGSGWVLEDAIAINNQGQILGSGKRNGQKAACLLTPQ